MSAPRPAAEADRATPPSRDTATDVVRWAAFSCLLVPVVLLGYGASLAGAAGTSLGLAVRRHASLAQIPLTVRAGSREHARGTARNAMVAALYRRFAQDSLARGG